MADADWANYKRLRGKDLPKVIHWQGYPFQLARVFKHDFYAATGLYQVGWENVADQVPRQVVLKVYHTDPFYLIPLRWLGKWLCRREMTVGKSLQGVDGIPQFLDPFGEAGMIRQFVPGCNLREGKGGPGPDKFFFPRLRALLATVHERGIAHCDLSKPENVLVGEDGQPILIDFQIAFYPRTRLPGLAWLGRRLLAYLQHVDGYHVGKNHRRYRPQDFTAEALAASRRKGLLLTLHGWLRRPYRAVRHFILQHFLLKKQETASAKI